MPRFHDSAFTKGTLNKLDILELYTTEWLPVFLSQQEPRFAEVHLFDFFAGPGKDAEGNPGSPLRTLKMLKKASLQGFAGWGKIPIVAHFFDISATVASELRKTIEDAKWSIVGVTIDIRAIAFADALVDYGPILKNAKAAKLLIIDQFGVGAVTEEIFRSLIGYPTSDFLFFISSSTLNRFYGHPAIKFKIDRPDDYYHVHRAVLDFFKNLVPPGDAYHLGQFAIKKGPNIYGLVFGSGHVRGIDKFLEVAWRKDALNGEADYDINRENIAPTEMLLPLEELKPTKQLVFERDLAGRLERGECRDEAAVIETCIEHGMRRKHAEPVLKRLKAEGTITLDFRVPDITRFRAPRPIRLTKF